LEGFDIFLDMCDLLSSNGGEGKPELDMLKENRGVWWGGGLKYLNVETGNPSSILDSSAFDYVTVLIQRVIQGGRVV